MLNVLLTSHIQKINEKHDLSDSDAFIVYCLSKILPIEEQVAKGYITDGPNDGNIDAFYFDLNEEENELVIYILNCKYYKEGSSRSIGEKEVRLLSNSIRKIIKGDSFTCFNEEIQQQIQEVSSLIQKHNYDFRMEVYFICSGGTPAAERTKAVAEEMENVAYYFWSLEDIVNFTSTTKKTVTLDIQKERLRIQIENSDIKSMVAVLPAESVIQLYEEGGKEKILSQNVRGFLGNTTVNKKIIESAEKSCKWANYFLLFNNGISIVCDFYEVSDFSATCRLKIVNPLIVNGGQTTKALYSLKESKQLAQKISVLTRIYETQQDHLINKITEGTNTQNSISLRDIKSNQAVQKKVKDYFSNKGIFLDIKRDLNSQQEKDNHKGFIANDTLLQAYVSFYKDLPHKAKSSRAWIFKKYFDEIFFNEKTSNPSRLPKIDSSDRLLKQLYLSYQIWSFCLQKINEEESITKKLLLQYALYTVIYTMGKLAPKIKEHSEKSLTAFENINEIYRRAVNLIQKLVWEERKRLKESYSHNNFFKSSDILSMISQEITHKK